MYRKCGSFLISFFVTRNFSWKWRFDGRKTRKSFKIILAAGTLHSSNEKLVLKSPRLVGRCPKNFSKTRRKQWCSETQEGRRSRREINSATIYTPKNRQCETVETKVSCNKIICSVMNCLWIWVVLQKLSLLRYTHFSQVLNKLEKKFSWFYKISSRSLFHLNYTSFPLPKQQQYGF